MSERTVVHDSFVIDRTYAAPPARVFAAFADIESKKQWFGDADIEQNPDHELDFRVGGRETLVAKAVDGGATYTYDAVYQDIVEPTRIVYSYEMTVDGRRMSVSVATVELLPDPDSTAGTRLVLTEQGAYLDGLDTNAQREEGTRQLCAGLAAYLERTAEQELSR